jgi:ribosome-associated protein
VVTGDLRVDDRLVIPGDELHWRFSRASGPGGQGVNTTDSRVALSWDVSGSTVLADDLRDRAVQRLGDRLVDGTITVVASEHRSQLRNREAARSRLADAVRRAIAAPPRPRRPTAPTRASQRRRIESKRRRGVLKRQRGRLDRGGPDE